MTVRLREQNARRVVIEGTVEGHPELTERWTIAVDAMAQNPSLYATKCAELQARLDQKLANWLAIQSQIQS